MAETELNTVPGWTEGQVARLARLGIATAEQVVSVNATEGGTGLLARELNLSTEEVSRLVDLARAALTPEARAAMDQPFNSGDRGMGARSPRE